jgi:hypothetical protein
MPETVTHVHLYPAEPPLDAKNVMKIAINDLVASCAVKT